MARQWIGHIAALVDEAARDALAEHFAFSCQRGLRNSPRAHERRRRVLKTSRTVAEFRIKRYRWRDAPTRRVIMQNTKGA